MASDALHESFERDEAVEGSTDRGFGLVFAVLGAAVGGVQLWIGHPHALWWLACASLLLLVSLVRPRLLAPLNRLWTKLGLLLFHVVSPLVMAFLYYLCVVPIGLTMRALGKDPLRLKLDRNEQTYWIARNPPGPPSEGMTNQF